MQSIASHVRQSCASSVTNCWRLKFGDKVFAIMPAHVAIYQNNSSKWTKSHFLNDLRHLKWSLPPLWIKEQSFGSDLVWSEVDLDYFALHSNLSSIQDPEEVTFYFNQPYNSKGESVFPPSLGALKAMVYSSPGSEDLEALGTGFRGMSGALALNVENEVVGMFLGRGEPLGVDKKASSLYNDLQKYPPMPRAMILPCVKMLEHIKNGGIPLDSVL